jgi:hypothetical protein
VDEAGTRLGAQRLLGAHQGRWDRDGRVRAERETSREDFSGCFPYNILNQCATVGTTIDVDIQVRTRAPRETIARLEKVLEDLVPSPLTEYGGKIFMDTTVPLQHGVVASVAPVWQVVKMEENVPFKSKVVGSTPASEAPHWHRLPWRLHV